MSVMPVMLPLPALLTLLKFHPHPAEINSATSRQKRLPARFIFMKARPEEQPMQAVGERGERRFQVAIEDEDAPLVRAAAAGDLRALERLAGPHPRPETSLPRRA